MDYQPNCSWFSQERQSLMKKIHYHVFLVKHFPTSFQSYNPPIKKTIHVIQIVGTS